MPFEHVMNFDDGQSLAEAFDNEYSMSGPPPLDGDANRAIDAVKGYSWDVVSSYVMGGKTILPFSGSGMLKLFRGANDLGALPKNKGDRVEISTAVYNGKGFQNDMSGGVVYQGKQYSGVNSIHYRIPMVVSSGDDLFSNEGNGQYGSHYCPAQWHGLKSVPLFFDIRKDVNTGVKRFLFGVRDYSGAEDSPTTNDTKLFYLGEDITRDKRVVLDIEVKWSYISGYVRIRIDGVLVAEFISGQNGTLGEVDSTVCNLGLASDKAVYAKFGSYFNSAHTLRDRTVLFDGIRISDSPPPAYTEPSDPVPDSGILGQHESLQTWGKYGSIAHVGSTAVKCTGFDRQFVFETFSTPVEAGDIVSISADFSNIGSSSGQDAVFIIKHPSSTATSDTAWGALAGTGPQTITATSTATSDGVLVFTVRLGSDTTETFGDILTIDNPVITKSAGAVARSTGVVVSNTIKTNTTLTNPTFTETEQGETVAAVDTNADGSLDVVVTDTPETPKPQQVIEGKDSGGVPVDAGKHQTLAISQPSGTITFTGLPEFGPLYAHFSQNGSKVVTAQLQRNLVAASTDEGSYMVMIKDGGVYTTA